ncbi:MAG: VanZ family protein [Burkholderiaceae bacterium]|nr:VanZ family protein [Burkholderiaceae bacterium]
MTRATVPHMRRATFWLAWIVGVLVMHGSLYPWRFKRPASIAQAWDHMVHQPSMWTTFGDVVGNVALFVPVGALGWALVHRWIGWRRALLVLAAGVAFAFVLQVAQLFVPAREAALSDVVWNALGLLIGMGLVAGGSRIHAPWLSRESLRAPLAMLLLWLVLQWWPMVPRLDWQQIKNALKPLLLTPRWSLLSAIEAALALMVVGSMLRGLRRRGAVVLALVLLAALGKLMMVHQALTLSRVVGWSIGLVGVWLLWRVPPRAAAWCMALAAWAWFTVDELRPFQFADALGEFHWLPFAALLQGSMVANTSALTWHLFWVGAVMLLARAQGTNTAPWAIVLSVWALVLELFQMLLRERVADITPALLPWVWLLVMPLLYPKDAQPAGPLARAV